MDQFIDLVKSRRSIRSYDENRPVSKEDLQLCMAAAKEAPSACNSQGWKFIAVDDPQIKKEISGKVLSGTYNMNAFAHTAAAFIVVVLENIKTTAWAGGKLMGTDFRRIDIGIASEHIVLQAQELGIGSCMLGWFNERNLKKILSIPRSKKIELIIALGYPPEGLELPEKHYKDKNDVMSFNSY